MKLGWRERENTSKKGGRLQEESKEIKFTNANKIIDFWGSESFNAAWR